MGANMRPFHRIIRDEADESPQEMNAPGRIIALREKLEVIRDELDSLRAPRTIAYLDSAIATLRNGDR
jgi:hypothetical protein